MVFFAFSSVIVHCFEKSFSDPGLNATHPNRGARGGS
jgi:hypothetical protein